MSSNQKSVFLGSAIALGLAFGTSAVNAGSITDTYATGDTLTATKMTNIKSAVNDNDTRLSGVIANTQAGALKTEVDKIGGIIANTQAGALKTEVDKIQGIINNTQAGTLKTTVDGHTTAITALQAPSASSACVGNPAVAGDTMVRVGSLCVDKYEATISGGVATSVAGNTPSGANWAAAVAACAAAGKRLPTNAEWQMAAAGTGGTCNSSGTLAANNANPSCTNAAGVVNAVGNIAEWVADWVGVTVTTTALSESFGVVRGGDATDGSQGIGWLRTGMDLSTATQAGNTIANGFRCVR